MVAFTGDWHCGLVLNGISRYDETTRVVEEMAAKIKGMKPPVTDLVITGDITERYKTPTTTELLRQILKYLRCFKDVKNIIMIKGNHDWRGMSFYEDILDNVKYIEKPENVRLSDGTYLSCVPFMNNTNLGDGGYTEVINKLAAELPKGCEKLFVGHAELLAPDALRSRTAAIPSEVLDQNGYKFSFVGHVHSHRKYDANKFYTGALIRNTFGEANETSGFWVLHNGKVKSIPLTTPKVLKNIPISTIEELDAVKKETKSGGLFKLKIAPNLDVDICKDYAKKIELGNNIVFNTDKEVVQDSSRTENGGDFSVRNVNIISLWNKFCEKSGYSKDIEDIGIDLFNGSSTQEIWDNFGKRKEPEVTESNLQGNIEQFDDPENMDELKLDELKSQFKKELQEELGFEWEM